jgi:3-oxoacyl-[acyl-carrier protein] reductase
MTGTPAAGRAVRRAAKAELLTRALALGPCRRNAERVVPDDETLRGLPGAPERPAHRQGLPPLGRRGLPEDVAGTVRFLCGPGARYITGQTLHVNGGGFMA